jgi:NADH:ubiquinone oxidoreductase subunit
MMKDFGTWLHTLLHGRYVGKDIFGNRYYVARKAVTGKRPKRWVMYEGMAEPSKVPALWHAWLHYMVDTLPDESTIPQHAWQKEHIPNMTGTANAYKPKGHLAASTVRDRSTSDYEAWTPKG